MANITNSVKLYVTLENVQFLDTIRNTEKDQTVTHKLNDILNDLRIKGTCTITQ